MMLTSLKSVVKALPYPVFLRAFYAWDSVSMRRRAETVRKRAGIPLLDDLDVSSHKGSDTLVVLGSGPSINRISAERWQMIARHDTVGFNWWPYHSFVPKFYFLESIEKTVSPTAFETYLELVNRRAAAYKSTIKIAMEFHRRGQQTVDFLPAAFRENLFAVHKTEAPARNEAELVQALHFLRAQGKFRTVRRFSSLLKCAASLTTTLVFALKLGYKRIVLCGIDLKTPDYFFQDRRYYPESWEQPPTEERTPTHFTEMSLTWKVPVTRAVAVIQRELLQPAGIDLLLESQDSALWPVLPLFVSESEFSETQPVQGLPSIRLA